MTSPHPHQRSFTTSVVIFLGIFSAVTRCQLDLETEIQRHRTFAQRIKEAYCNFNCRPAYIFTRLRATHCRNVCSEFYGQTGGPIPAPGPAIAPGPVHAPPSVLPSRVPAPTVLHQTQLIKYPTIDKPVKLPLQPLANNFKINAGQEKRQTIVLPGVKHPGVVTPRGAVPRAPVATRRPVVQLPGVRLPSRPPGLPARRRSLLPASGLVRRPHRPLPPVPKVCNKPNWQPCVSKAAANQKVLACCQRAGLSPSCQAICNYDTTSSELRSAYLTKKCTQAESEQLLVCGANGRNLEQCCQDVGVFSERRDRCRPYCFPENPHGLPKPSVANLRCFSQFEKIQQCFWASQV